jgi:hypothetical protein
MKRSVPINPALPRALRKVEIPNAAKIPPKINHSHIAVLGVRRGMIWGCRMPFSVYSIRLSMVPERHDGSGVVNGLKARASRLN